MAEDMRPLDWAVVSVVLICCVCLTIYSTLRRFAKTGVRFYRQTGRVLFVIAHPDDECMFFAPTILSLTRSGQYDVFVLCLSTGNHYSQGRLRQHELVHSCCTLGVRQSNVFVLDHSDLPDDPNVDWPKELVAKLLLDYVKNYYIDLVFTFDHRGVSGHQNHKSVYHGVRHCLMSEDCPAGVCGYQLVSINVLRKYISFLELAMSYFTSKVIFIASWPDLMKAQAAMYCHKTQLRWFRKLYIMFSRYMVVNTYSPIVPDTKVCKRQ